LRTRDVVVATGLPDWVIHRLAADGDIPSVLGRNGKRRYDPKLLRSPKVRSVIDRALETHGAASLASAGVDDELLGSTAAAHYLGLGTSLIRFLVRTGTLVNRGSVAAPAYRRADLDALLGELRETTGRPDDDFAAVATATQVADLFAVTTSVVNRMLAAGVVRGLRLGQLVLVLRSSLEELPSRTAEALDPDRRLLAADVAELVGIDESTVTHHVRSGSLPAVQMYPRARLYFLRREVEEWLATRSVSPTT
jgi:predicted DNA-binding transcriptional regulator AlpA